MSETLTAPAPPALATVEPALSIQHVTKTFRMPHQRYNTLKERVLHPLRFRTFDTFTAVDDITVDIAPGEFFGIVGRNGSGKSTLLKCLAGIYEIDGGDVEVRGRLSPFIELGVGFNPELTARENVLINAIMLGLSRKEARERFDEIIRFAELEEFLDLKLKNYSSGMVVRLAFSVAIQVDADILLVDEVLAVGDAAFQQKCFDQFHRMREDGRTIVFVTHDMGAVQRFCHRAMLIDRGKVQMIGEPAKIARAYNELNFGGLPVDAPVARDERPPEAEIADAWFENGAGERVAAIEQNEPLRMAMDVRFTQAIEDPVFTFAIRNDVGHTVFTTSSDHAGVPTGTFAAGESTVVRVTFDNVLATVRHSLVAGVVRPRGGGTLDLREDIASVVVHGLRQTGALVDLPHTWELGR